ncbi:MAG: nitronate monooxygenase, partial [Miltoncostaeaceae bacterium]
MTSPRNELLARLGIRHPILQAPMAGGPTTPALVAAVSEAGALGNLGCAYMPPDALRAAVRAVRDLTAKPFGANLFARLPADSADPARTAELD